MFKFALKSSPVVFKYVSNSSKKGLQVCKGKEEVKHLTKQTKIYKALIPISFFPNMCVGTDKRIIRCSLTLSDYVYHF